MVLAQYNEVQFLPGRDVAVGSKVTDAPVSAPETEPAIDHTPQMVADLTPPADDIELDPSAMMSLSYYGQDALEIIAPNGEIIFFELDTNTGITNIGQHRDNDLVLDNPDVPLLRICCGRIIAPDTDDLLVQTLRRGFASHYQQRQRSDNLPLRGGRYGAALFI
jgi:hypothetical protein